MNNTTTGVAILTAVLVLATVWAVLEHRRTERRRRQDLARAQRPARVLDLEAAGAAVRYTTERHYDESLILAAKKRAETRDARLREIAADRTSPAARVARFSRRR